MNCRLLSGRTPRLLILLACLAVLPACSLKTMAVKTVASSLSDTGDVFSGDNDPDLVRDASPFALKLYEIMLQSAPTDRPLLVATCSAFTQYAYAFVQADADIARFDDYDKSVYLDGRALNLYLRAHDYCMRALELRFPGVGAALGRDGGAALQRAEPRDVPLLYWTAASLGEAIALAPDRPDLLIDFPVVRTLLGRAIALDETWNHGALHEMFITLESLQTLGGSVDKAREHFARAIELDGGKAPGPYVALAMGVSVADQNREEFETLMNKALAIDPEADPSNRLVTLVTQRRARALLDHVDSLFSK